MIVVGFVSSAPGGSSLAVDVARRAAATGARVEMVGAAGSDGTGDARLLELAAAGVGHATVIRARADGLEPADLDLALRYLPDIRAIVLVRPPSRLIPTALAAAEWAASPLVIVGPLDAESLSAIDGAPTQPIVLDPPTRDLDETFAGFVAALAVRLDAGDAPDAAWRATLRTLAIDAVARR